jgi:dTDP-4-amino-4,6-dideoxygalactose transaminase
LAAYTGARHAVAVVNGTAALHIALILAGVKEGDEVISTAMTAEPTNVAIKMVGAKVRWADVDYETGNIAPKAIESSINEKTKAIIVVDYAGTPVDVKSIQEISVKYNIPVIEDAAHALGATYPNGKRVGCCENSLMTIFSFHPVKAIAAGEGGMITTNDETTYRKLIRSRSHGINKLDDPLHVLAEAFTDGERNPWYYEMQELGFHYRITDIQCALALSQFKKLETFINRRRELVKNYDLAFSGMKNFHPAQMSGRDQSGHHLYVLSTDFKKIGLTRSQVMKKLKEHGVGSQVHYIPVPMHPYYQKLGHNMNNYPNAQDYYNQALSIPLFYDLTSDEQKKVIFTIDKIIG